MAIILPGQKGKMVDYLIGRILRNFVEGTYPRPVTVMDPEGKPVEPPPNELEEWEAKDAKA